MLAYKWQCKWRRGSFAWQSAHIERGSVFKGKEASAFSGGFGDVDAFAADVDDELWVGRAMFGVKGTLGDAAAEEAVEEVDEEVLEDREQGESGGETTCEASSKDASVIGIGCCIGAGKLALAWAAKTSSALRHAEAAKAKLGVPENK